MSLFVAGSIFGDVGISLFVAGSLQTKCAPKVRKVRVGNDSWVFGFMLEVRI